MGAKAGTHLKRVSRQDLANVLAVTELGLHMLQRDEIWIDRHYRKLFARSRDASDYLARWWLFRQARRIANEQTTEARHDGYWAVIWLLWTHAGLSKVFDDHAVREAFIGANEYGAEDVLKPLHIAMRRLFILSGAVYERERKKYERQARAEGYEKSFVSPRVFFRRRETEELLARALRQDRKRHRSVREKVRDLAQKLKQYY